MTYFRRYSPIFILLVGIGIMVSDLFFIKSLSPVSMILVLVSFLWACEHYYIPVDQFGFSLILPILFVLSNNWSVSIAVICIGLITLIDGLVFKRWQMRLPVYPFILVIALTGSIVVTHIFKTVVNLDWNHPEGELVWSLSYTIVFFLIKWGLGLLAKEKGRRIKKQAGWNIFVFIVSTLYCWLSLSISHQNRGNIDSLAYFFFYSPLVTASLLVSFTSRLQREKQRLDSVFALTSLVNSGITDEDPIYEVVMGLRKLISIDASIFWLNENAQWDVYHSFGEVQDDLELTPMVIQDFLQMYQAVELQPDDRIAQFFQKNIRTTIFAPLRVEGDLIGIWVIGSRQQAAYSKSDFQTFMTLSHQVAAVGKTRRLVRQQETHKIFEERNRIAREIHDGVAQTIAGAVMNLQSFDKAYQRSTLEAKQLVDNTLEKLRTSLKQVRASIYELRPHPFQQIGFIQAIHDRVNIFQEDNPHVQVRVVVKGTEINLGVFIENGIFDIFKEALRNIEKHSNATKITIFVGYLENAFCLFIKDDGIGFSLGESLFRAKMNQNFGILNMNDVAEKLNGNLDIKSRKGKGTKVIITVPYSTKKGA